MINKIKSSLTLRVFLLTFALLLAVSGITYGFVAWTLPVTYVSRLDSTLEQHAQELLKELEKSTLETCDGLFAGFREKYGASAALEHPDGTVTFPGLNIAGTPPHAIEEKNSSYDETGVYDILLPGTDGDKRYSFSFADDSGIYTLLVIGKTEEVNQVTGTLLRILPWLVCLIVGVSLLTAFWYSRYLVRPVTRLSRSAKKMAGLDFSGRCDEDRSDEIGVLGKNLNDLSKKLSAALSELQTANQQLEIDMYREREQEHHRLEFFSAVSHELKTPITVIKGQLEGMLDKVGAYRDRDKYLARSLEVACSMESMVAEILNISRMETTGYAPDKTAFDFSELIREQLARYMDLIEQKRLTWNAELEDHLTVTADKKLMAQVVSNLLSNAIQYSPQEATLQLEVYSQRDEVFLSIENSGVQLPEEEIPRLFEAFYRVESSRNRKTGGSGLGLYLAGRILRLHGAQYRIQNTSTGVRFSFPSLGRGRTNRHSRQNRIGGKRQEPAAPVSSFFQLHTNSIKAPEGLQKLLVSCKHPIRNLQKGAMLMYIFKNAFLNLGRNKGRNILMAVILFVILFAVAVSIVVNSSTTQLIDRQKATFGAPVTLVADYRKMTKQTSSSLPTAEEWMRYSDSDLLMRAQLFTDLLASLDGKGLSGGMKDGFVQDGNKGPGEFDWVIEKDISDEFTSGMRKIVSGDYLSGAGQALISKDLAELNGWGLGDSITVYIVGDLDETSSTSNMSMTLKIVGIYEDHTSADKSSNSNRGNEIFTDFKALVASDAYKAARGITQAQFVLKNPADLAAFEKELHDKGLPGYYKVTVDDSAYDKIVAPLEGLKSITLTLTIVVTIFGAAVLLILAILSIRERKYEVGVLRAMGVKKGKVSLGLLTETLLITAVCLVLAVGSASVLSKPIGNALLQTQATSQSGGPQDNTNDQGDKVLSVEGGFKNTTADEADLPELDPKLDSKAAAQIALIALLLACAASAVSVVFVTRFEPMKILSERN